MRASSGDSVIASLLALLFGLLIGSFLNVCIHRWPRNRSVVKPRSHCVRCRKPIAWYDNIPLASYLVLGGRCRQCGARISVRYPLVEFLTGMLFFYQVSTLGPTVAALKMCVFSAIAVALIFCDLEKRILPDEFTLGGIVLGLIFAGLVPRSEPGFVSMVYSLATGSELPNWLWAPAESAFGAILPAFFLWFAGWLYFKIRHREGLGLGDVKLVAMVGSFLGLSGALLTLILGSIAGSVIGYSYIKLTGKDPSSYELPFGTFLGAAALVAAIVGNQLLPM
jgi:leader peptidase (prepilin peptidase) / N-methyltransferase